ncbi:tRNA (adenosine(37)-N6)-dimethylallyltransferase MiaA [Ascidiimonas aurantiaca]|uniref:tRNA (adenosine(37)-N6)-dimethylallyltransferase MiaA n=1 Tax=Ascidiimonas aurantiaca TaxID=1685432 RepID=UPI0030EF89B2
MTSTKNGKTLITVIGPTAIGKTALAIQLARHFNTHIISADSRQFYKEMTIGTAVPTDEELLAVPHHFVQHKSIHEQYTVGDFERDAISKLNDELFKTHTTVIMAGGSGLYVNAVLKGIDTFPEIPDTVRESLNKTLKDKGIENLQNQLKEKDPDYFKKVDRYNPHRLIRALEVCLASGQPYSSFLTSPRSQRSFHAILVGLTADREVIYSRINKRVDMMMSQGLLEEARSLYIHRTCNALQTVGYRELFSYFEKKISLETAVEEIKKNTRRFAKRQLTWFKKNEDVHWFPHNTPLEKIIEEIENHIRYQ